MEFFQSKEIKIFLTAFIAMVALTLGAMKLAGSQHAISADTAEETLLETGETPDILPEESQPTEQESEAQPQDKPQVNSDVYKSGSKAESEGDLKSAIKYYNVAANSDDPKTKSAALGALAGIYMQYNDSKMIIETLEKQLEIEKDTEIRKKAYVNLAETYKYLDTYDKAIEMYKESYKAKKTPNDVLRLCELYEKLHDDESIRNQINDYLAVYPQEAMIFQKYKTYMMEAPVETNQQDNQPEVKEFNPAKDEETEEASESENNQE